MKLINDWKQAIGHYSTVALSGIVALPTIWAANPQIHVLIPAEKLAIATAVIGAAGLIGKFLQQGGPTVTLPKQPESHDIADTIKEAVKKKGVEIVAGAITKALK